METNTATVQLSGIARTWNLLGGIGIFGTLVSLFSEWVWVADLFAQLSVQYLGLVTIGLPLWILRRMKKTLIIGALAVGFNLYMIAPYFVASRTHVSCEHHFRLVVFNVLRTNTEVLPTLAEAVSCDADMIFLMETGPNWQKTLEGLAEIYPHQKIICREDYTGVAFLSKSPWQSLEVVDVPDANPPLDIFYDVGEKQFRLLLTHPLPPISPELARARNQQLRSLADTVSNELPTIFAGDFNLPPWSAHFDAILETGALTDLSIGKGVTPTLAPFPTWFGGVKVDHFLGMRKYMPKTSGSGKQDTRIIDR